MGLHETGHLLDDFVGPYKIQLLAPSGEPVPFGAFPLGRLEPSLLKLYDHMKSPYRAGRETPERLRIGPEYFGHHDREARRAELWANAGHVALYDPNRAITVAPDVFATLQKYINEHEQMRHWLQLSSLLGGAIGLGAAQPGETPARQGSPSL